MTDQPIPTGTMNKVLEEIREEDVVQLALDLANIDSPTGEEGAVSDFIHKWMVEQGFAARRVGLYPDRCNVAAVWKGVGGGSSLLFNGHMDTTIAKEEILTTRLAADPIYHSGWTEDGKVIGNGVLNNKGVMATWLSACATLKNAGVRLRGDLVLTAVVGEIGLEPVDEFQPPKYIAKEAGAKYITNRGYVADYAVVAEGTDFTIGWVEAGKAFFKVTVLGVDPPIYTPYIRRPSTIEESPNAIVRASKVIQALESWASEYEGRHRLETEGGTVVPKVNIGAIRGGVPWKITKTPAVCHLYVDTRITPVQNPLDVKRELEEVLKGVGVPTEVELYAYRRGYESKGVKPLVASLTRAHSRLFGGPPAPPIPAVTSMWRDSNVFAEAGVPTVIYGPGGSVGGGIFAIEAKDLLRGAQVYAGVAMEVCGVASV